MVKLGQQVSQKAGQGRVTRTDRIIYKAKVEKQREAERQKYESEKAQAEVLSEKLWKPVEYKEGEVTKTREFTNEDYGDFVENLSPELKKFFVTKEQLVTQQTDWRGEQKVLVQTELQKLRQKQVDDEAKIKQKIIDREAWFSNKSSKYRHDPKNKQRQEDALDDYEDELEEKQAYYRGAIQKLEWGEGQINAGEMYSFEDIQKTAFDYGYYLSERERSRNEAREFNEKQALKGLTPIYAKGQNKITGWISQEQKAELPSYILKTGMTASGSYGRGYDVSKFDTFTSTQKYSQKVGFENLSVEQQKILNPSAVKWQEENPNEKLKFDKSGNIVGITSGKLGGKTYTMAKYNDKKTWQDFNYKEWENDNKKINIPFKFVDVGKNYYTGQTPQTDGMGNIIYPKVAISEKQYYLRPDTNSLFSSAWGKIKGGYNWIDDRVRWDVGISGTLSSPKLSVISFGKQELQDGTAEKVPTNVENIFDKGGAKLQSASQGIDKWVVGQGEIDEFKTNIDTKYQEQYQSQFENKYMKSLIYENISFDEASASFSGSDEAKIIQKKYQEEYGEGYKELTTFTVKDDGFLRTAKAEVLGGIAQTGISIASLGLKAFRTPTSSALTVGAVYTGVKVFTAVPSAVNYGLMGASVVYGGSKFLGKDSTYTEAGAGLTTAVISGYFLGRAGLKYLKSPVVTRKTIPAPKKTLTTDAIGTEKNSFLMKMQGETKKVEQVYYGSQKLGQYGFAGSRAEVTTKWRELGNKYLGMKFDPIYYGVPTKQLGYVRDYGFFRTTKLSGYEKSKNLLIKYGYSQSQATGTLRYVAPKYIEQYLESGKILVSGNQAIGNFKYLTKQPVLDVDDVLGIKTRGARSIRNTYNFNREIVGTTKAGDLIVLEKGEKISALVTKQGASYNMLNQAGKTRTLYTQLSAVKGSDITEALIPSKYDYVYAVSKYQVLRGAYAKKQLIPFIRQIERGETTSYLLKNAGKGELQVLDLDKIATAQRGYDVSKVSKYGVTPADIKKTPFSSTFGKTDDVKDLKNLINKITDDKISPVVTKTNIEKEIFSQGQSQQSQYYGQGLYEKTSDAGLLNVQGSQSLKFVNTPQIQTPKMFSQVATPTLKMDSLLVGEILSVGSMSALKSNLKLNNMLKMDLKMDLGLKQEVGLKSQIKQLTSLKQTSAQKSALKSALTIAPVSTNLLTINPVINIAPITPKPPIIPQIIGISKKQAKKRAKKRAKEVSEINALLPDFTSRAIGLAPTSVGGVEGALKEIRKLQTGFGIRRGVRIVENTNNKKGRKKDISDRQLIKSVMA